jgi:hypothetical protein
MATSAARSRNPHDSDVRRQPPTLLPDTRAEGSHRMAIFEVIMFEVKPGRDEQFMSFVRDLNGILRRIDTGLENITASRAFIAGQNSGRVTLRFQYSDLAAWSKSIEAEVNDPAILKLMEQFDADPPATMVNRLLAREIQL